MKKLIGLLIIILVLLFAGYYGTGLMTEKTLKRDISLINQSNGLLAEIKNYNRGWFTSKADLDWKLTIPERVQKDSSGKLQVIPAQTYTLNMPLNIYHGPVMFAPDGVHFGLGYAKTLLTLPPELKTQVESKFKQESTLPKLNLSILVNYLNKSSYRANLPEFQLLAKDNLGQFNWDGLTSSVSVSSNLDEINGDMNLSGLEVKNKNTNAKLKDFSSEYDLYLSENGLYLGEASVNLPLIEVTKSTQKVFQLNDFSAHSESNVDDGLFHSTLTISLGKVVADNQTYGPGELKLSIKNLDADTLGKINKQMQEIQGGSDQMKQQAMLSLIPDLPKLLSHGAEINISQLNFALPDGKVEGNLTVSLPEGDSAHPFQMLKEVKGEAMLQVPQTILKDALKETAKQQLIKKPTLTDTLANQMQQSNSSDNQAGSIENADQGTALTDIAQNEQSQTMDTNDAQQSAAMSGSNDNEVVNQPVTQQMTLADLDKKADAKANDKIQSLLAAGSLKQEGDKYVIHVKLTNGKLTVNGQPFNSNMVRY